MATPGQLFIPVLLASWLTPNTPNYQDTPSWGVSEELPPRLPTFRGPFPFDPYFSRVVFLDFAQALFHKVQHARGTQDWDSIAPFVSKAVIRRAAKVSTQIEKVIVGSIRVVSANRGEQEDSIEVEILANVIEDRGSGLQTFSVEEHWEFTRAPGSTSPTPERAKSLGCPSCGSPVELTNRGRCTHCDQAVTSRGVGFRLSAVKEIFREILPPLSPNSEEPEEGTDLPTVYDPNRAIGIRKLSEMHPGHDWNQFARFVQQTFLALQEAWSEQDSRKLRALETDRLYQVHRFWLSHYQAQAWKNHIEQVEVTKVTIARVEVDHFYESVTVRIRAKMVDYTVDGNGQVQIGSRTKLHPFSEYWTFIRSTQAAGAHAGNIKSCPACGAPRDRVNEKGICEYCDADIVGGTHDWVLTSIQQDEDYL